jgi:hypothetical protein
VRDGEAPRLPGHLRARRGCTPRERVVSFVDENAEELADLVQIVASCLKKQFSHVGNRLRRGVALEVSRASESALNRWVPYSRGSPCSCPSSCLAPPAERRAARLPPWLPATGARAGPTPTTLPERAAQGPMPARCCYRRAVYRFGTGLCRWVR